MSVCLSVVHGQCFFNLTQASVTQEDGTSTVELSSPGQPVDMSTGHCLDQ